MPATAQAMPRLEVRVERRWIVSARPFADVVQRLTAPVGRPDMRAFHAGLLSASTLAELEALVRGVIGPSGLMEFARFDAGEVLAKADAGPRRGLLRLLVGNPLIMRTMAVRVRDAAAYAPVTILVDECDDGVHVSFDTMASLLAPSEDATALAVARDLDATIERLIVGAAR